MLLKLAARNIRRSIKDYAIYFVTLVFGVAVFYAFNSIGDQRILFDLESSGRADIFQSTQIFLSMFSTVVTAVLGFLIVYANRFLIRRRKHEFGIYLSLGMGPGEISRIVLYETVMVGLASLAVGLVVGIMASQALSFATAALFNISMEQYRFIFSQHALNYTLLCFAGIYLVVAVFNLVSVSRYKLVNLLSAHARNEQSPVRNPWVCLVAFLAAVGILAYAYQQLMENGLVMLNDPSFMRATVGMLVGTLVLFWSLAGFVIAVLQRARGVYFRGLTMFTVRQIASKVNTAFLSLWAICVMLFFAITTFSVGMGLVNLFNDSLDESVPYDATLRADVWYSNWKELAENDELTGGDQAIDLSGNDGRRAHMELTKPDFYAECAQWDFNVLAKLEADMPHWNDLVKNAAEVDFYNAMGVTYSDLFDAAGVDASTMGATLDAVHESSVTFVGVGQFNDNLALLGKKPLELGEDEFAVCNTISFTEEAARTIVDTRANFEVMGHALHATGEVVEVNLDNNTTSATGCVLVVPDAVIADLRADGAIPLYSYVNVMYRTPGFETDAAMRSDLAVASPLEGGRTAEINGQSLEWAMKMWPVTLFITQTDMHDQASGLRMMITYLAIYIGFVLLVTTAAILAIQQLSEAADSVSRYRLLGRLGCNERMLSHSLLAQILVYFLAPLAVAACHSACAIGTVSGTLFDMFGTSVTEPILMAAGFVVVVYGSYLLVTYFASRSIMRQALKA